MHLHWFQHVPFEGLGAIEGWAAARRATITATRFYAGEQPDGCDFDWLVIMGGPMSVHDQFQYPWLSREKKAISRAIDDGKTVIGICLGAQLIAEVLGARVTANNHREIGWFQVRLTSAARNDPLTDGLPETFPALHWHGETFSIPPRSRHLAASTACVNQAFSYDRRVLALQFHLEATAASTAGLIHNCRHEMQPGPWVQDSRDIVCREDFFSRANMLLERLLDNLEKVSAG